MKKISQQIVRLLKKKKLKISLAESCTGGMLSSNITSISGASKVFNLGLVAYSNETKIKVLKISKKIIKKYGAVSKEVCLMMANNISKIAKTDVSASITGIAGPGGGYKKKPVGLVYIGIKNKQKTFFKKYLFKNRNRKYIQYKAVKKTAELLIKTLQ
tara:strand:+ start:393 stop:866 length:474 start_codon:yes stop_codon:yes gene_type:complete